MCEVVDTPGWVVEIKTGDIGYLHGASLYRI